MQTATAPFRHHLRLLTVTCLLAWLQPRPASAEVQVMPAERWQPSADAKGLQQTNSGALLGHLDVEAGIFGGYERNPVTVRDPDKGFLLFNEDQNNALVKNSPLRRKRSALVANRAHTQLSVAVGLFEWVELFGTLPVALYQERGEGASRVMREREAINQFALGDVRLGAKIQILRAEKFFVDLAVLPTLTLPIGFGFHLFELGNNNGFPTVRPDPGIGPWASGYMSDGFPTLQPELALSRDLLGFFVGGNVGLRLRRPFEVAGTVITHEVFARAGAGFKAKKLANRLSFLRYFPVELGLEATAAGPINLPYVTVPYVTPAASKTAPELRVIPLPPVHANQAAAELIGSAGLDIFWMHPYVGASVGVLPGYGVPDFRVFGGVRVSTEFGLRFPPRKSAPPAPAPTPPAAEPPPEPPPPPPPPPDTDGDGVADPDDACPTIPGDAEHKGCPPPPPDTDRDGFADPDDACPNEPGDAEHKGCPPPVDPCTLPMASRPATDAAQLCPDADMDGDGIINSQDSCPNDPEDKDGFEDADGCPDTDNDHDGIPDAQDQCLNEPETINGVKDDDGCPDVGKSLVKLDAERQRINIGEKIYFETNKATIKGASFNLLQQVASILKANPTLKIRVEGHTDNVGTPEHNLKLSGDRAASVREFLIEHGIPAERLEAAGYGQERNIKSNKTAKGREANRRVEFVVIAEEPK